jgi:hypothetical protein
MNVNFTLSNDQRALVRKVITSHPDWPNYRANFGYTASDLTSARCIEAAAYLGIDIQAALDGAPMLPMETPTMNAPAKVKPTDAAQTLDLLRSVLGGTVDESQVRAIVDSALAPVLEALGKPQILVVDANNNAKGKPLPITRHPMAETLLMACTARKPDGHHINVWIAGPAGSGKTYAAKQIAESLGLSFGFHGAMTMAHELTGFVDAGGHYHETQFVKLYRDGGLCLLDEVDAGSSEALLALNGALANGLMSLPNGQIITRHADFVCIAAANTWGSGATAEYVGRAKIDSAFLDRFGARLAWGYDEKLERDTSGNPEWARRVQAARQKAKDKGLKVLITPRASIDGAALIACGMKADDVAKITYLASLTPEQVKMLES